MKKQPSLPSLKSLIMVPDSGVSFYTERLAHVFQITQKSICGMCGKQYSSRQEAWACLSHDVLKLSSFPVRAINAHEECFVQCLLCGKLYINAEKTAQCLEKDLEKFELPVAVENHLRYLIGLVLAGQNLSKREALLTRERDKLHQAPPPKLTKIEEPKVEPPPVEKPAPPPAPKLPEPPRDEDDDVLIVKQSTHEITSELEAVPKLAEKA